LVNVEELAKKFKEACLTVKGEFEETPTKLICRPAEELKLVFDKRNGSMKVYSDKKLVKWDYVVDVIGVEKTVTGADVAESLLHAALFMRGFALKDIEDLAEIARRRIGQKELRLEVDFKDITDLVFVAEDGVALVNVHPEVTEVAEPFQEEYREKVMRALRAAAVSALRRRVR